MKIKYLIFLLAAILAGCHKKTQIERISFNYVQNELQSELRGRKLDSVSVVSIDSLNRFSYITTSMHFLNEFEEGCQASYAAAEELNDEDAMLSNRTHLAAIHEAQGYYEECLPRFSEQDTDYVLYLVTAYFHVGKQKEKFFYFLTPDMKVHPFNPLDSSPID